MRFLALLAFIAAGCTFDLRVGEVAASDAGSDAGLDSGIEPERDAGFDAGVDAGTGTPPDGGADGGAPDGGPDGGVVIDELPTFTGLSRIATGKNHTCGLTQGGALFCWGLNNQGQLGNGTTVATSRPVPVSGLGSGVRAVALGDEHSCAITAAGAVLCWGDNQAHQLGDGTYARRLTPNPTWIKSDAVALALGSEHTCVLLNDGTVTCWSSNRLRQLDHSFGSSGTAVSISGPGPNVVSLSAADDRTCAVASGQVYCWGNNVPGATVPSLSDARSVAVGPKHACATTPGGVACWGFNSGGRLGAAMPSWTDVPIVSLVGATSVTGLTVGRIHSCAIVAGTVKCWGANNTGQLGLGPAISSTSTASDVALPPGVVDLSAREDRTCAVLADGTARCWGDGALGELGNGVSNLVPTVVPGLRASQLVGGYGHRCALSVDGGVDCWGTNQEWQLSGTGKGGHERVRVDGLVAPVALSAQWFASCAVDSNGRLLCWGRAPYSSGGHQSAVAAEVRGFSAGVKSVWSGDDRSCALGSDGGVSCWYGTNTPEPVVGLGFEPRKVVVAVRHACALGPAGEVVCWGSNDLGQLGLGVETSQPTLGRPLGLSSGVTDLAAGRDFTCALLNGSARCWGSGRSGQLARGHTDDGSTPTEVKGLDAGVAALFAGESTACAVTTAGALFCWGSNQGSVLGTGDSSAVWGLVATPSSLVGDGVSQMAIGLASACALRADGRVLCWSSNGAGQLGHTESWATPRPVVAPAE